MSKYFFILMLAAFCGFNFLDAKSREGQLELRIYSLEPSTDPSIDPIVVEVPYGITYRELTEAIEKKSKMGLESLFLRDHQHNTFRANLGSKERVPLAIFRQEALAVFDKF